MKTNKSYTKRMKVTATGKLVARKPGQNHFNARESAKQQLHKQRTKQVVLTPRVRNRFIPYN